MERTGVRLPEQLAYKGEPFFSSMAEPGDFGASGALKANTTTITRVTFNHAFGDLPSGTIFEMKLTVNGQSATKTLTVPPNKTATSVVLTLDGVLV